MDIRQAKQQIKNAMLAYFSKDEFGNYRLPTERQRPVFLLGAPGIGKTAIMEQIAQDLDVGFVSYSMTHHTRQSALGLPFIAKKTYDGVEYDVSEYTMSEIIAAVYDAMEATGKREGILFLDEINCVSETLTPAMLQFLQYKIFGRHRVPDGWIVVTAGNPPEYNRTAHDFDIATWDRLKRIDVEPDFAAWRDFAVETGVHPAVLTYLDIERDHFYRVETTVDGYAGPIRQWTGVDSNGHVTGLVVRDMEETFGLGRNALTDIDFLVQFVGTSGEAEVGGGVDAITGATVTSRAVARGVSSACAYVTGADVSTSATEWGG